jgi:3-hydroxyacyl-CoA dehydrogenase
MQQGEFTIEEVDRLTGTLIGHPKTATFRTIDLVGVDIFVHVADNIYENAPDDPQREIFRVPQFMRLMLEQSCSAKPAAATKGGDQSSRSI